jgi:hypothetical protein
MEAAVRRMEAHGYRVRIQGGSARVRIIATDPRRGRETFTARSSVADAAWAMAELARLLDVEVGPVPS